MPFPLGAVLAAAPGVISAAADIITAIKTRKKNTSPTSETSKLQELEELLEKQAQVLEELAKNNGQLAEAVRNNRIITMFSIGIAIGAVIVSLFF